MLDAVSSPNSVLLNENLASQDESQLLCEPKELMKVKLTDNWRKHVSGQLNNLITLKLDRYFDTRVQAESEPDSPQKPAGVVKIVVKRKDSLPELEQSTRRTVKESKSSRKPTGRELKLESLLEKRKQRHRRALTQAGPGHKLSVSSTAVAKDRDHG